eukprot:gene9782-1981_t
MEEAQENTRDLFDRFTMGMIQTLENCQHVVDIRSKPTSPLSTNDIASWEARQATKLPSDIRDFYSATNGLHIIWTVLLDRQILPVGSLLINPLDQLKPINPSSDLPPNVQHFFKTSSVTDDVQVVHRCRYMPFKAFAISSCGAHASVALVYTRPTPSIWLVDRSNTWHRLAKTFTEYYRLMTLYLGIPEWQYALTSIGALPDTYRWLHAFVSPHVLIREFPRDSSSTETIDRSEKPNSHPPIL